MIDVMVVDDDALTLELHSTYVARIPGFRVSAECAGAYAALRGLVGPDPRPPVDLVLLDMTMPDGSGVDVLRTLRARGSTVDVIAVTSVRDAETVRATASLGVVQYLVKPFPFSMFRERLEEFRAGTDERAARTGGTTQAEIDALLGAGRRPPSPPAPKGLSAQTLDSVSAVLRTHGAVSAAEAAEILGLSRVAARRYLEHLVGVGAAAKAPRYGRPGRPETEYRRAM